MIKEYSPQTKLADIVFSEAVLLSVLERLKIDLGFGEATISQICSKYNLSTELFVSICNIYTSQDYVPSLDKIEKGDILKLVEYLKVSHKFYSEKSLPSLHKKIHKLLGSGDDAKRKVLHSFYDNYDSEIAKHFAYEEKEVFPYIQNLVKGKVETKNQKMSVAIFRENHENIEEKLADLKSIILKYLPAEFPYKERFAVLREIFEIEADLIRHTQVEDKLLIPLVAKLEEVLHK